MSEDAIVLTICIVFAGGILSLFYKYRADAERDAAVLAKCIGVLLAPVVSLGLLLGLLFGIVKLIKWMWNF